MTEKEDLLTVGVGQRLTDLLVNALGVLEGIHTQTTPDFVIDTIRKGRHAPLETEWVKEFQAEHGEEPRPGSVWYGETDKEYIVVRPRKRLELLPEQG